MNHLILLAQDTLIDPNRQAAVRDAFLNVHDPNAPLTTVRWVLAAAGLMVLMLLLNSFNRWYQKHLARTKPIRTFHRLASELGVGADDQFLLVRIAQQQELPSPLTLLLSRSTLRRHGEQFAQTLGPVQQPKVLRQIARLRRQVFLTAAD